MLRSYVSVCNQFSCVSVNVAVGVSFSSHVDTSPKVRHTSLQQHIIVYLALFDD
jgi:hypothetical protein